MSAEEILGIVRRGLPEPIRRWVQDSLARKGYGRAGDDTTVDALAAGYRLTSIKRNGPPRNKLRLSHQTALDMFQKGDVFVADAFGNATQAASSAIISLITSGKPPALASLSMVRFAIFRALLRSAWAAITAMPSRPRSTTSWSRHKRSGANRQSYGTTRGCGVRRS